MTMAVDHVYATWTVLESGDLAPGSEELGQLAPVGSRVVVTRNPGDDCWAMEFRTSDDTLTTQIRPCGRTLQSEDANGRPIDLLVGGFEHIHSHILIARITGPTSANKHDMRAWVFALHDLGSIHALLESGDTVRIPVLGNGGTETEARSRKKKTGTRTRTVVTPRHYTGTWHAEH
jgi:hypothetical protein